MAQKKETAKKASTAKRKEEKALETVTVELPEGVMLEMKELPSGIFMGVVPVTKLQWWSLVGSSRGEPRPDESEANKAMTDIRRDRPEEMGVGSEESYEEFEANHGSIYRDFSDFRDYVNAFTCETFLEALNETDSAKSAGLHFRLPTEEEWLYAFRAGAKGKNVRCLRDDGEKITDANLDTISWGDHAEGWKHDVGGKRPNAFGLHDMIGLVLQWTSDNSSSYHGGKTGVAYGEASGEAHEETPFQDVDTYALDEGCPLFTDIGFRLCADRTAGAGRKTKAPAKKKDRVVDSAVVEGIVSSMIPIPGKDYRMGKFPVTQAQWEAVMGKNPSEFKGADRPVECVSWDDCQAFLETLNATPAAKASGLVFRLPEENEWEFACRAGATGDYCKLADGTEITEDTLGEVAWFDENSVGKTHPVGRKKPNAFGLYDMHGNVWEWTNTADGVHRRWRVRSGGSWHLSASCCVSSCRTGFLPDYWLNDLGFRLCADRRAESNDGPPPAE